MNENIKYITENYIEWDELCKISNISSEELESLIKNELIPDASYVFNSKTQISSPLQDKVIVEETKKYFPKSVIKLIIKNKILKNKSEFKNCFKSEFKSALEDNPDKKYAYDNIFDKQGIIDKDKLNSVFEQRWEYYCQGIYGICTLNSTASDIVKKEIAVKKLIEFNDKNKDRKLDEKEKIILKKLNQEFNNVAKIFAPYQRQSSSRGKYLDEIIKLNSLDELIMKYN